MAAIAIDDLSKAYVKGQAEMPALVKLSLEVEAGQALALLGPNGAGKSTIVRILSTLVRPDSGRATIAGFDVVKQAPRVRESVGVALQEVGLYSAGRVRQILIHHARLFGLGRRAATQRANEIVELAGLGQVAGRRVHRLSGGMRRRLDLGLALIHQPPVLLLDEPTNSLDPFSRREFWGELARLRDRGTCILFASQDIEEAEQLADRVAILADGALWRDDLPAALVREEWWNDGVIGVG
jgi:ABC-type multidrug transport system ATPase subunit